MPGSAGADAPPGAETALIGTGMTDSFDIGERDVLLVVDVQNDFCPGGALAVAHGDQVVPTINRLARRFSHVVLTQDWHPAAHQ